MLSFFVGAKGISLLDFIMNKCTLVNSESMVLLHLLDHLGPHQNIVSTSTVSHTTFSKARDSGF
jgi:hypothetical protein